MTGERVAGPPPKGLFGHRTPTVAASPSSPSRRRQRAVTRLARRSTEPASRMRSCRTPPTSSSDLVPRDRHGGIGGDDPAVVGVHEGLVGRLPLAKHAHSPSSAKATQSWLTTSDPRVTTGTNRASLERRKSVWAGNRWETGQACPWIRLGRNAESDCELGSRLSPLLHLVAVVPAESLVVFAAHRAKVRGLVPASQTHRDDVVERVGDLRAADATLQERRDRRCPSIRPARAVLAVPAGQP